MKKKLLVVVLLFSLLFGSLSVPAEASISAGLRKFLAEFGPAIVEFLGDVLGSTGSDAGSTKKWRPMPVRCPESEYGKDVVRIMCAEGNENCIPMECRKIQG